MSTSTYFDQNRFAGETLYGDLPRRRIFWDKTEEIETRPATILMGQVLKAYTFLAVDAATNKIVAHPGIYATGTFGAALTSGQTLILNGLTWTAGVSGTTAAQLATAWSNIPVGTGFAALSAVTGGGSFTAGTLTGFKTVADTSTTIAIKAAVQGTSISDIAISGTGAAALTTSTSGNDVINTPIYGVLLYDIDATAADVKTQCYSEASFWAIEDGTDALLWAYNPTDTIMQADGITPRTCTFYNTGCSGTTDAAKLLKQRFVTNSEFDGIQTEIEVA
jgi:hypothetical protein